MSDTQARTRRSGDGTEAGMGETERDLVIAELSTTHYLIPNGLFWEIVEAASWRSADAHDLLLRVANNQPKVSDEEETR